MNDAVNEHVEIIKKTAFHTYPFNFLTFNPNDPHTEDCGGCIINAEVDKLVDKLNEFSHVEDIIAQLEEVQEEKRLLKLDRVYAFRKAGKNVGDGTITDLVTELIDERDALISKLQEIKKGIGNISESLYKM